LALAVSCREAGPTPASRSAARHLVLVTVDTLRADHVGAYGGTVPTPNLDRLAREGALVEQASAHVPLTRPSHVSLFSGLLPTETGVRDNVSPAVAPDSPLLAEVLRAAGFATAGFVSSVVLARASGLDRGFERYADAFEADPEDPRFLNTAQKRGDRTLAEALAWLEENRRAPRLGLWLHLYDPHDPYEPPEPYASRFSDRPYAGEVAWSDELVGRLDAALARLGLAEDTLLVVTADHGEGLGEHGESLHGFFAYESTLRVPLLLRGPGVAPAIRLEGPVGLVDLLPTLLDLLDLPPPPGLPGRGRSIAAALGGGAPPPAAPLYAESLVPRLHFGWSELRVLRAGRWKYIQAPRPELYDLARDPGETVDRLAEEGARAQGLRASLEGFLARERARERLAAGAGTTAPAPALPAELAEKLGALGYLGGGSPATTSDPGADPKDRIEDFRIASDLMRQGLLRLHEGDLARAARAFEALLGRGVESAELHLYLGRALSGLERFAEAADHFGEAAARTPAYSGAWLGMAEAQERLGDPAAALEALRRGRQALPAHVGLRIEEGRLLRRLGQPGAAAEALRAALAAEPGSGRAHALLGEVLRDLGDAAGALLHLQRAVELEPGRAGSWNALGMILGGEGQLREAEHAFREAWRLDSTDPHHAYNLGFALLRQGRSPEARPFFEQALALRPGFLPARERLAELDRGPG
jgi:arylsulfatase A-like enzyme/Tfp pilus assembly protein PilF